MYKNAIVRRPCENIVRGLSRSNLGKPDYTLALQQHDTYIAALRKSGVSVDIIPDDDNFPDSVFIEDAAICIPEAAIITRPGAPSRQGEVRQVENELLKYYSELNYIEEPGTVDGGDIMKVDTQFFIGISERTNENGAYQVAEFVKKHGYSASVIDIKKALHLKTGVSYLGNNKMLVSGEFIDHKLFFGYEKVVVPTTETMAANCLNINGLVLMPKGCPETLSMVRNAGFKTMELNISEFQKLDGSLSCLSLLF